MIFNTQSVFFFWTPFLSFCLKIWSLKIWDLSWPLLPLATTCGGGGSDGESVCHHQRRDSYNLLWSSHSTLTMVPFPDCLGMRLVLLHCACAKLSTWLLSYGDLFTVRWSPFSAYHGHTRPLMGLSSYKLQQQKEGGNKISANPHAWLVSIIQRLLLWWKLGY